MQGNDIGKALERSGTGHLKLILRNAKDVAERLRRGQELYSGAGLCNGDANLGGVIDAVVEFWPRYSGNPLYPVVSLDPDDVPEEGVQGVPGTEYARYMAKGRLAEWQYDNLPKYNESTHYGRERLRLLGWCIFILETELFGRGHYV